MSLWFISRSRISVIAFFSSSTDLKYLPASRLLRSHHTFSIWFSYGVYGGRNSSSMPPLVDSTYSLTARDLWYDALSRTM